MKKIILMMALISLMSCKKENLQNDLDGVWMEESYTTMYISGTDTTYSYYSYVGDMYCCGATTVDVSGNGFEVNDVVQIGSDDYLIVYIMPDDSDPIWRYFIQLRILNPYDGCKSEMGIYKRTND